MTALRLRAVGLRSAFAGPFDVELPAGACLAITGPSGAGKSLFLRMLADLDDHSGEAWVDGRPRSTMPAPDWRRHVRYVAAEPGWWHDTVGEHFATDPSALLASLGLSADILQRQVQRCSTGERQRLALARALLDRPPVLLLDEPTGALDGESTVQAERLLARATAEGATLVVVTHNPAQALRLGTTQARIAGGRMLPA